MGQMSRAAYGGIRRMENFVRTARQIMDDNDIFRTEGKLNSQYNNKAYSLRK
jgi:hypothetical protein